MFRGWVGVPGLDPVRCIEAVAYTAVAKRKLSTQIRQHRMYLFQRSNQRSEWGDRPVESQSYDIDIGRSRYRLEHGRS